MRSPKEKIDSVNVLIRRLSANDDLNELTDLLHRAYKKLADEGFKYLATHQNVNTTKDRIEKGTCLIAEYHGRMIGTITYYPPQNTNGHKWYDKKDVASFHQFAVEPELQNFGIGRMMINEVEILASKDNAGEIAIDTAEGAAVLIKFYKKRGYRHVGYANWDVTNYRSVIMSKKLK